MNRAEGMILLMTFVIDSCHSLRKILRIRLLTYVTVQRPESVLS